MLRLWKIPEPHFGYHMRIGGLQKTTMLDFPGKVSAVVFTQGCNFLCPYCHNADLVLYRQEPLALTEVIAFLAQRKRVLEGVVISGGEPTLQNDLPLFCATVKGLGYEVKLDTNGSRPEVLRQLLQENLVDYVAVDIKADPARYPKEIAPGGIGDALSQTIALLREGIVPHEFRIPCVSPFINQGSMMSILDALSGYSASIFLQEVRLEHVLEPHFFMDLGRALNFDELGKLKRQIIDSGHSCDIR